MGAHFRPFLFLFLATSCGSRSPSIQVDVSEAPDTRAWMEQVRDTCVEWLPRLHARLDPGGELPSMRIQLVAKAELEWPAATAGRTILIQAEHVRAQPEDTGMVIHELVHVLQDYPPPAPGWLIEGIADDLRYYLFQPGTNQRFDPHEVDFRKGYWPASAFLDWIEETHDPELLPALHGALRAGSYQDELFRERTGRTLDELWQEFASTSRPEFVTTTPR